MTQLSVPEFFKGRDIFITGGTGFIGKVLIEKLLRTCPNLNRIFILIRVKKGIDPTERLNKVLADPLYELIKNDNSNYFEKIVAINGDVALPNLGINVKDLEMMSNVSVIFHSAASVRFDESLKDAIQKNTRGTNELMKLAEKLSNIRVIVHVSTTYCNPDQHVVEEKLYPARVDWRKAIKMSETYSEDELNTLFNKLSDNQPNTYTFSKCLAEQVVNDYKNKLPVVIFRPSIVVSTYLEPIPGWIDNINGPMGFFLGSGTGFVRTLKGDPDLVLDHVPVDCVVSTMISAAYKRGIEDSKLNELPVYNCALSLQYPIRHKYLVNIAKELINKHPIEKMVWVPGNGTIKCRFENYLRVIFFHIIMGTVIDTIFRLLKKKPFALRLYRKIFEANEALYIFQTTYWEFRNEKLMALDKSLLPQDIQRFGLRPFLNFDVSLFFENAIIGGKHYIFGDPKVSTKGAHIRLKIFRILHNTIQIIFFGYLIILCKRFIISYVKEYV